MTINWEPFVFSNQTETITVTVFFACILLLFVFLKTCKTLTFQFSKIDIFLLIYGIYLLFRFKYPIEQEIVFQSFSILCIYLYFRIFPDKFLTGLLVLIPLAGVAQMIDGISRFTMPWQNLSHITGIFNNTGLFGGFAALGFIVCTGLFFFSDSGKCYSKLDCFALLAMTKSVVLFILCIVLAIQAYASGSRASCLALFVATAYLFYRFVLPSLRGALTKKQSKTIFFFLVSCLLILTVFFSNYLYHLKKDSADGRLLIARVSMEMVKAAPVFGHGISGFKAEYLNYQANYFEANPASAWANLADDVDTPFNEFLKILVEQGIVGLLLFSFLLFFLLKKAMTKNTYRYILQSVILFILTFGLFSCPFDKLPFVVLFVFSIAGLSRNGNAVFKIQSREISYLSIPLFLLFFFISLRIAFIAYNYSGTCKIWNSALANFGSDREKSLSTLKILHPTLNNNPVFLTTYGRALSFGEHYSEAATVLEKAVKRLPLSTSYIELGKCCEASGFPQKALACWNRAGSMVPARFAPLYLTMKLHFKNGDYEQAKEYAKRLLAKKVKIDNPEIDEMKREAAEILNFHPPPE